MAGLAEFVAYWLKARSDRAIGVPRDRLRACLGREDSLTSMFNVHGRAVLDSGIEQLIEQGLLYEAGLDDAGTPVLSIIQDSFGEYLAARWLVNTIKDNMAFVVAVGRLTEAGRFESGWQYAIEMRPRNSRREEHRGQGLRQSPADAATLGSDTRDRIIGYIDTLAW